MGYTPIAVKDLGQDSLTTLNKQEQVWQITICAKSEQIIVVYDTVLIAPNGAIANVLSIDNYTRYNRKEVLYSQGELITAEVVNQDGTITPAVYATGTEIKIPAKLVFDQYRGANVGQMIAGMIQQTINSGTSPYTQE